MQVGDHALPEALVACLADGRWRRSDRAKLAALAPWIDVPVAFLEADPMRWETAQLREVAGLPALANPMRFGFRAELGEKADALPWLDAYRAVLIAVNERDGDDVAIALDYRVDPPRVVATRRDEAGAAWVELAPSFEAFAAALGL